MSIDINYLWQDAQEHANQNMPDKVWQSYQQICKAETNNLEIHINFANLFRTLASFDYAESTYRNAITLAPNNPQLHNDLGWTLRKQFRLEEALNEFNLALQLSPQYHGARANRSLILLQLGNYAQGWQDYEARLLDCPELKSAAPIPFWQGQPINGKIILIVCEQGFGDQIQFLRYAPLLAERGAVVDILIKPEMVRLAKTLPGIRNAYFSSDGPISFDYQVQLMSLPYLFNTTLSIVPNKTPYFFPQTSDIKKWQSYLISDKYKVGLVWSGATRADDTDANNMDRRRSVPFNLFAEIIASDEFNNCQFVNLQLHTSANEQAQIAKLGERICTPTKSITDFYDSAGLIANLDLVISVDTSVVHLAGALGKSVWLLNRYDQCWRWLRERSDSPWYLSAKLFQQKQAGDWQGVIAEVKAQLLQRTTNTNH